MSQIRAPYARAMADLTNAQIAAAFDELGDLYELDGAVAYRVIAYRTAAKTVRESTVSIVQMARDGRVTELNGIGKIIEEKILALDETGDIPTAKKLRDKFPSGLLSVMHLPGFGPKRARRLYDELGVDSLDALRAAAEAQIEALADLGIAMGAAGATVSSETADAVITVDRVDRVADAVSIGRRSLRIARQSVLAGMGLSIGAMGFAAAGHLTPVEGALLQEAIDVAVIVNALRALRDS